MKILNNIGFDLDSFPTFFDIVELLMAQGIVFTSDATMSSAVNDERITSQVEKYVDLLVLIGLQDNKLVNTNQYLIACSICCAARKLSGISPDWPQELEQLTGLQLVHFSTIEKRIL